MLRCVRRLLATPVDHQIRQYNAHITVLPGDGIGPEITDAALRVLDTMQHFDSIGSLDFSTHPFGAASIDRDGEPLTASTLKACASADAVLLGAVGDPRYGPHSPVRPEAGLLALRRSLSLFANLRPVMLPSPATSAPLSPLKWRHAHRTDVLFVRELTGGSYFGPKLEPQAASPPFSEAHDLDAYTADEVRRVAHVAFVAARLRAAARGVHTAEGPVARVVSVDKANVLASSRLWRRIVEEVAKEYPDVELTHELVDSFAMRLVTAPNAYDVVLTSNLFGDILTDLAAAVPGSLGLLPSASVAGAPTAADVSPDARNAADGVTSLLSETGVRPAGAPTQVPGGAFGLYEPIHGSAPDIAGRGIANPIGTILSAALMCRYSLRSERAATVIEDSVRYVLDSGTVPQDLVPRGGASKSQWPALRVVGSAEFADLVVAQARELAGRRPMTLAEKLLASRSLSGTQRSVGVKPGDFACVAVDWSICSELTWAGMEKTYDAVGRPGLRRPERFWLAIDHTVDPRINDQPKPQRLIAQADRLRVEIPQIDYQPPNTTILHTDFYRKRLLPGQVVVGADSHTCSGGALGSFVIGLGAADVLMAAVTGETWFRVPETVEVRFVGRLKAGLGGKDVILHILQKLKRNTVALERVVEYTGAIDQLSCDARFAIANMTTEFGGLTGVFAADERTADYLAHLRPGGAQPNTSVRAANNTSGAAAGKEKVGTSALARVNRRRASGEQTKPGCEAWRAAYLAADRGAQYAETYIIDLGEVAPMVAMWPSPDKGVPVHEVAGKKLDGVFIGACTTTHEELVLGALVLQEGLKQGLKPREGGLRRVTPGSVGIAAALENFGLLDVYREAGFEIGAPGCSYCLGIAADVAGEGEVWLSSQNRNFENRMGKGSIANLASAATVAASSFDMSITDPTPLVDAVDPADFEAMCAAVPSAAASAADLPPVRLVPLAPLPEDMAEAPPISGSRTPASSAGTGKLQGQLRGKVALFGEHIDTDAIIPAQFMPGESDEDLGSHAFEFVAPDFRRWVKQGHTIVVAGPGFGSGSSREEAPRALRGIGVQAVIAKSFAYIYARNQPNVGLPGIVITDEKFYDAVGASAEWQASPDVSTGTSLNAEVDVDFDARVVRVSGMEFPFELAVVEERLLAGGGTEKLYARFGPQLFRKCIE
eukprot:TRINITY_DN69198_c0_g1_i1.p1 TRINITY_DN69198_c0_g1~~TRINITY_DN69198_c0_g1_i1.p1  ORF type:complete len:1171 (+),score=183.04 TRINITY_DN69198_c0_g1_i1:180-3692(+)